MAGTRSDSSRARGLSALSRRLSLRLRLTLLYGGCFLLGSSAVLAIIYVLVAHDTSSQTRQLRVPALTVAPLTRPDAGSASNGPGATPLIKQIHVTVNGKQSVVWVPSNASADEALRKAARSGQSATAAAPQLSDAQLAELRSGALAMSRCMRAHGIRNYPDVEVSRSREYGYVLTDPGPSVVGPGFKADNVTCSRLVNDAFPGEARINRQIGRHNAALLKQHAVFDQKQVNVVVNRANGALTTQRRSSLRALLTWSGVALGVMAMVSILFGWLLAGGALRPLRTMTSRAREITEENLHERLSVDAREDELGDLATTFDGVLARLENAFEAQKRFVANASHELRTPVTLERALLEIALSDPDADATELRHACERVLASTERQERTIESLLTLARSQGGSDIQGPVDLADLAEDAIALREQRLDNLTVATDLHPAPLTGDPALLERLVANLIENAIVHNLVDDAWITIETGTRNDRSWLRVSNSGPEIPEARITDIFEPFRRIDGERTATATGLGLGLSIVQAIADAHDATVEARPVDGGGLQVEARF